MLEPLKHMLESKLIILASGSPRRRQIFEQNLVYYNNSHSEKIFYSQINIPKINKGSKSKDYSFMLSRKSNQIKLQISGCICARKFSFESAWSRTRQQG